MNNKTLIIHKLIDFIEDCFNLDRVTINKNSILLDFCPDELDIELFITEVNLHFHVDLKETFGVRLIHVPIFELAEYLLENSQK